MLRQLLIGFGKFLRRMDFYVLIGTFLTLLGVVLPLVPSDNLYAFFKFETTWGLISYIGIILIIFVLVIIVSQILGIITIYWGRSIPVDVDVLEFIQTNSTPKYISLKITNHEREDLIDCRASMTIAEQVLDPTNVLEILDYINPNELLMSWGGGSNTEYVTIPGDDGSKVLNIGYAEPSEGQLVFLFYGWESPPLKADIKYHVSIKIDGRLDGERFRPIRHEACIKSRKYIRQSGDTPNIALEFVECKMDDKKTRKNAT